MSANTCSGAEPVHIAAILPGVLRDIQLRRLIRDADPRHFGPVRGENPNRPKKGQPHGVPSVP